MNYPNPKNQENSSNNQNAPILRFSDLTLGYNRHPAIHHLKGEIKKGCFLAIAGPNGGGKSTLLKGIVNELSPLEGIVERFNITPQSIAYLPQQAHFDASFPISIIDFVALGLWQKCGAFLKINTEHQQKIKAAIDACGLSGLENKPIGETSGGQLQRARFAQVMVQDSPLVLLDEPYAAIDAQTTFDLARLLKTWNAEGRTIISVLHDLTHIKQEYPNCLLLAREVIAWGKTADVLSAENQQKAHQTLMQQSAAKIICAPHLAHVAHQKHTEHSKNHQHNHELN